MAFPIPISAFSFDEGTGSTALSSINGYSLTAQNSSTAWGGGRNGGAAAGSFTGAIGNSLLTWSVQFDVYTDSFSGWASIIEGDNLYFECGGTGAFDVFGDAVAGTVSGATLSASTWHTITVTHDNTSYETKIYTDGTLTTTKPHGSATAAAGFDQALEICGSVAQPFSGRVDNLRVWDVVLTQTEVDEAGSTPVTTPGSSSVNIWNGSSWMGVEPRIWNGSAWVMKTTTPVEPSEPVGGVEFPRLAGMLIGSPHNYEQASYQQQIAKLDMAILGMYNGWGPGGITSAQAVSAIKSHNPNILLGNYTIMTEVMTSSSDTATQDMRAKLTAEQGPDGVGDWWAYDSAGNHTNWSGGTYSVWDTNMTLQTTPDNNGDRWPQWLAKRDNSKLIANADWDIWYSDNNMWRPRSDADWDRNGSNDSANDLTVQNAWRDGQRAYYDTALSLQPDAVLMINADNDLDGSTYPSEAQPFTQYKNLLGGAFLEHIMGKDWSPETWGGWSTAMGWYHKAMSNLIVPKACIFDAYMGDNPTDYRTMRYAFASSLMNDGYFSVSSDYNQVLWYDEFDLAGSSDTKWLGAAIDGPQTAPWQSGVYRRRFANGMVLINPKGSGQKTVTVDSGYHRFSGSQDPTINDGQAVTSTVTLADRDALFLVKD